MLWVERKPRHASRVADAGDSVASEHASTRTLEQITWKQALLVGFAQCLAMIPGTSRSGATIIGGMMSGIDRKAATEFSFFLARSEEHTSELQSLMRISYAVFCLKKKK